MKAELVLAPNPVLTAPCESLPTPMSDKTVRKMSELAHGMRRVMKQHKGVGLAANQVGVGLQLLVAQHMVMANPVLTWSSEVLTADWEACLSEPGLGKVLVSRPIAVRVQFCPLLAESDPVEMRFDGKIARIIQHEMDHLQGKLLSDYKK